MSKAAMYAKIYDMRRYSPIVAKAYGLLASEQLEDKEHLLMAIVLEQAAALESMKAENAKHRSNYYRSVKACENYAEIHRLKSTETAIPSQI